MTAPTEQPLDINALLTELAALGKANPDNPEPLIVGTFAMYPTPDGGLMAVTNVPEGTMSGIHHHHIPANLIRLGASLMGSGKKISALKGLFSKGRKEIGA